MENAVTILEEFFGSKFQYMDINLSETRELTFFDGFAHWQILLSETGDILFITADEKPYLNATPTIEITIYFNSLINHVLHDGYTALQIIPNNMGEDVCPLTITKTKDGRFSASVGMGRWSGE